MTSTITNGGDRVVDGHYRALPDQLQDDLLTLVLNLATEVWTLRDRTRLLEAVLDEQGNAVTAQIDARRDDPDMLTAMIVDRDAFVDRLFRAVVQIRTAAVQDE